MLNMKQPAQHLIYGQIGEDLAAKWLISKGFKVVGRHYLKKCGEIDIVAKKGNELHFVEVKTTSHVNHETLDGSEPQDNVHFKKKLRLSRVIEIYLEDKGLDDADFVVDVLCVYLDKQGSVQRFDFIEDIEL